MKHVTADDVRYFLNRHYIEPARKAGQHQVRIRAGAVHDAMKLTARMPLVCSVLDGKRLEEYARVTRLDHAGPRQGATAWFTFSILP